jgi:hypothetical protein
MGDRYWSERALEANRKKLPVLKWQGSEETSHSNPRALSGQVAAETSEDLANSPADQSGYAFSVEKSLFSFMPPTYFDFPGIGSEEVKEPVNMEIEANGDIFLRSLIPSQVTKDGRFPIPTPYGFELIDLTVRKAAGLEATQIEVQTWRTPRGYQAEVVGEKIPEVFLEAVFRYKTEPNAYEPKENLLMQLPWNGLQRVAEKMRTSPLKSLSAALDHFLANGRIVSAQDLARLISQHSLYSFHPSPTLRGTIDSFDALAGFLNSEGTLCIQCNVAAALLANWLKEIWAGVEGVEVRVVTVLAYEDGSLRRAPHAVVEVRKNGVRLALLDPTPDELDPRAPLPLTALQFQSASSPGSKFDYEVRMLEDARSELVSKAEFFAPERVNVFEPQSDFVRLNVTAAAVAGWIHNELSYQDLLKQTGMKSFAELQTHADNLASSAKRWTYDWPGRLTEKEQVIRDFYRGIEPEIEEVATALKRVLKSVAEKESCNENLVHLIH